MILVLGSTGIILAQEVGSEAGKNPNFLPDLMENMVVIMGVVVILGAMLSLLHLVNVLVQVEKIKLMQEHGVEAVEKAALVNKTPLWKRLYKKWTNVVPIEKENDILFDHEYDGIRELDNSLPPWWVAMFYITIAFAVVYLGYYHFSSYGQSSIQAYEQEVADAEDAIKEYLAKQTDLVDETNVTLLEDGVAVSTGKTIFETNCTACHGALGEGGVGPNLTDPYWIHGGDIKDVFKTIKYGVPEKGMIAWKAQLNPGDMQKVSSYIMTLAGTNPPNSKAPEGEKYEASNSSKEEMMAKDSSMIGQVIGMK